MALTVNWLLVNTGIYRVWLTLGKNLKARKLLKATEKKVEMMKKKAKMKKAQQKREAKQEERKDNKLQEADNEHNGKPVGGLERGGRNLWASLLGSRPTDSNGKKESRGKSASLSSTAPGDQNV